MIQKYIYNNRIIFIHKVLIAIVFIVHSNIWSTLEAEEIENFRKRGELTVKDFLYVCGAEGTSG